MVFADVIGADVDDISVDYTTVAPKSTSLSPGTDANVSSTAPTTAPESQFMIALASVGTGCIVFAAIFVAPFASDRTPKRLLVQHVYRKVNGVPLDAGLWISAFDSSKLGPLKDVPTFPHTRKNPIIVLVI